MAADASASSPLRLRAEDPDDLAVVSAVLQDSLVSLRDLAYDPAERSFLFVANRFRWEGRVAARTGATEFERVLCGVTFDEVSAVSYRGFRRSNTDGILSLLAIRTVVGGEDVVIYLDFSAGAEIRLTAGRIRCHARDLGEPWPTAWLPGHPADETA